MDKLIVFILGSVIGSFLNVCIWRFPKGESIIRPRSYCPHCKTPIMWHDNIPILSYLILRARCRACGGAISFRYFLVEIITAVLTLLLFVTFGLTAKFFAYSVLAFGLIVATFVDFKVQEIPDQVSLGGIVIGLAISYAFPSIFGLSSRASGLLHSFIGALAGGASIYLMGFFGELVFRREAMGGGDVKLMAMIGSFLGWKLVIFTFFMAPVFGSIVGIALKLKDGREVIPYGPYLSLAALLAIFFGNRIISFFLYRLY